MGENLQKYTETLDDSMINFDNSLAPLLMNFDNDVKYIKILSQEDFNEIEPDNDTIYFVNNIYETVNSIKNILDVAASHTKRDTSEPEHIWALTVDEEMEEVSLWRAPFNNSGHFSLVKIYHNFKDGRLTFDGIYEYNEDYSKATLITNNEPFLVLIRSDGQLRAFPNLNTKDLNDGEPGRLITGDENQPVVACSVEKGYCSELFKEYDQGVVIAYSIFVSGRYELRYRQFRYVNPSDTIRQLAGEVIICSKTEEIFNIAVRRLSDYRLGITYNYWVNKENGEKVSYTEFRYSTRQYVGVAYHPEVIEIQGLPEIGQILYGAVRNDNIVGPERPYLGLADKMSIIDFKDENKDAENGQAKGVKKNTIKATELTFSLVANNNSDPEDAYPIQIELINVNENSTEFEVADEVDYSNMLGFTISSIWLDNYRFSNNTLEGDPDYPLNSAYAPDILKVRTEKNNLIITIRGEGIPLTPFKIIPTTEVNNIINLRYNVAPFNIMGDGKNLAGWFALTNFQSTELGSVKYKDCSSQPCTFSDYYKQLLSQSRFLTNSGSHRKGEKKFNISFQVEEGSGGGMSQAPHVEKREIDSSITINYSGSYGSGVTRRIKSINV